MRLYLVRHGQTDANFDGNLQGLRNNPLNDTGRRQAKNLSDKIKTKKFDICYCSPLIRTVETAMILVGDRVEIVRDNRLLERDMGELEGLNKSFYDLEKYWDRELNCNDLKIEPINSMYDRSKDILDCLKKKYNDRDVLLVSHGGVIRVLLSVINDKKFEGKVPNCSFIEVEY